MFIFLASVAALIAASAEIIFFFNMGKNDKSIVLNLFKIIVKNVLAVDLISLAVQRYIMQYKHFLVTDGYNKSNYLSFFLVALVVGLLLQCLFAFVNGFFVFEPCDEYKKKRLAIMVKIVSIVLFALGCAAYFGTIWGKNAFGDVSGDQLVVNLTSPTEGTEKSVYIDGFEGPVFQTLLCTTVFALIDFAKVKIVFKKAEKIKNVFPEIAKRVVCLVLAIVVLIGGVNYGVSEFKLKQLFNAYCVHSDFFEKVYVAPEDVKISFPKKKRNLIHIYLESMENSFLSKKLGGNMNKNLMPELTKLSYSGIIFSDTDKKFGGPAVGTGTNWSMASMVNQTTGLPMKAPGNHNDYGSPDKFLPGAVALGDLLEKNGYEQTVMIGASASFGGFGYFYKNHGNWTVFDYNYAKEKGLIPPDYKVWWGFEDDKLYEFAKGEITRLYKTGKPFNFTVETADTHRPNGYIGPNTPTPYENSYANAVAYSTAQAVKFIKWIQKQPFYKDTTIVIIGDHLSMETTFFEFYKFTPDYHRTQFNLILNPAPGVFRGNKKITNNRIWCNWDLYPTILAGMGVKISGDRLGVGTNLFSGKETVFEEYGVEFVNEEFEKNSELYTQKILGGQTELDAEEVSKNNRNQ